MFRKVALRARSDRLSLPLPASRLTGRLRSARDSDLRRGVHAPERAAGHGGHGDGVGRRDLRQREAQGAQVTVTRLLRGVAGRRGGGKVGAGGRGWPFFGGLENSEPRSRLGAPRKGFLKEVVRKVVGTPVVVLPRCSGVSTNPKLSCPRPALAHIWPRSQR